MIVVGIPRSTQECPREAEDKETRKQRSMWEKITLLCVAAAAVTLVSQRAHNNNNNTIGTKNNKGNLRSPHQAQEETKKTINLQFLEWKG